MIYSFMWGTSWGTGFKPLYCSFSYLKSSWNAKGVSMLGTTSFDGRLSAMLFNCRQQLTFLLWNRRNNFVSGIIAIDETWRDSVWSVQGPVVQSVVSLTSSLRVISLTVLADSIHNILIFFAEKMWVAFSLQKLLTFFQQKISEYLRIIDVNFNESLTNDIVSFEQLGPELLAAGPVILYDNAAPHLSEGSTSLLARYKWETLPHPPYSSDLSPCDFDLFCRLKEIMRRVRFEDLEGLEDAVDEQIRMYERG